MYNIADYRAVGDGATLNTKAIQAAVDACAAAGGGMVYLPGGTFVSGPILLKSNVEFHLSAGAVLRGSRNLDDYYAGTSRSLLTASKLENVALTGSGTVDGQGDVWWAAQAAGTLKGWRPSLVLFSDCSRVLIDGVKLTNSPSWTVQPLRCQNVSINHVTIVNPWNAYHNCDGIDPMSCRNVQITNCHIDTGDDGIVLKTVPGIPCENITIADCVVEHAHGGVVIGSETAGGVRNVTVNNCVFDGTRSGVYVKGSQNVVENVRVNNIVMRRVEWVLLLSAQEYTSEIPKDAPPVYRNIHFNNITATQARVACEMYGLANMPMRDISFSNIRIDADKGFDIRDAENISLDNVTVTCPGPALRAEDTRNLEVQRLTAPQPQAGIPIIQLTNASDTWIHGCTAATGTDLFVGLVGEKNAGLVLEENRLTNAKQAQAPVASMLNWSTTSYAYSGSSMWQTGEGKNLYLPVPAAVWETITREWSKHRITWTINGIHRLESGALPNLVLDPGDKRRIYIITVWDVDEQLIILEDGTLLRKAEKFNWRME